MSLPPYPVRAARQAMLEALEDIEPGSTVVVACSGGADSMALVSTLAYVGPRSGWRTGAVLIDHGMQDGSAEVTARAAQACRDLGMHLVESRRIEVASGSGSGGPEGAARRGRYQALNAVAGEIEADVVLLGHTLDDQAETVLLGLGRGSGARSLSGMRATIGAFRRPFLTLTREHTEEICRHEGIDFWVDPTNELSDASAPLRSQVRLRLLPLMEEILGPGIAQTLARTGELLHQDAQALEELSAELLASAKVPNGANRGDDCVTLNLDVLAASPRAVRTRTLRAAALAAGAPAGSVTYRHIVEIDRLVSDWHGQGPVYLPLGLTVSRERDTIVFIPR